MVKVENTLYTIGYEGISIDKYIEKLSNFNIKIVIDVRKNAFSYKKGFTKEELKETLLKNNILYYHIPELGIDSEKRKGIKLTIEPTITLFGEEKSDLQKIFDEYKILLPKKEKYINILLNIINKYNNVALTCFEKDYKCCHRSIIADYIKNKVDKVIHL